MKSLYPTTLEAERSHKESKKARWLERASHSLGGRFTGLFFSLPLQLYLSQQRLQLCATISPQGRHSLVQTAPSLGDLGITARTVFFAFGQVTDILVGKCGNITWVSSCNRR